MAEEAAAKPAVTEDETKKAAETAKAGDADPAVSGVDSGDKAEDVAEKKEESIYDSELPNRIIVGRTHPLSFYVDRARRVFRIEEEVYVQGRGDNIATTCKLVEALKRQKIATIGKISTGMNVEPYFNSYGDAKWGQPTAIVLFTLKRGEFGKYIADYQQRKIIEIFENNDEKQEGILTLDKVESLQLDTRFRAKDEQIKESKDFLSNLNGKTLNLPDFIKYASILIHPLLKAKVFKDILSTEFKLEVSGGSRQKETPAPAQDD